ncbi:MAG: hypothetical protein GF417_11865, partial [Candidatus Latescibacteria bacterium]|nr:hypothetical protein [bacterium]MBD3425122.1 hypothetical protein [Candidatus Latescibacterota bacterium]
MSKAPCVFIVLIISILFLTISPSAETLPREILHLPWGDDPAAEVRFRVEPDCRYGPQSFRVDPETGAVSILDPVGRSIRIFLDGNSTQRIEAPGFSRDFLIDSGGDHVFLVRNQLIRIEEGGLKSTISRDNPLPLIEGIFSEKGEVRILNHDGTISRLARGAIVEDEGSGVISGGSSYRAVRVSSSRARILVGDRTGNTVKSLELPVSTGDLGCVRIIGADRSGRIYLDIDFVERAVPLQVRREVWILDRQGVHLGTIEIPTHYYTRIFRDLELAEDGTLYHMISSNDGLHIFRWEVPLTGGFFRGEYPDEFRREVHYNYMLADESPGTGTYPRPMPGGAMADTVTRAEATGKADTYVQHTWTASSANIADGVVTDPDGDLVDTPDWIVVGQNQHIPYKFGGVDELSEYDSGIAAGNYAGDIHTSGSSDYASGVDCSGFVCRCWKTDSDYSTRQMDDPAYGPITLPYSNWDQIKPGDAVHRHGHVRMAVDTLENGTLLTVESAGSSTGWKVDYVTYTLSELISYSPRYYIHMEGIPAIGAIQSAGSGSWTSGSTWVGGAVPDSMDNVLINAGHTISVDDNSAMCKDLSFGGNDALIDMNSNSTLTVYGDMTIYSTSHCVFSAGWSSSNAYIKFAGSAVQTLSGWDTAGGSTSFRDVIVDKSGGKLQTAGNDMRLGIQNSLEIVSGLFELEEADDIEGRWASSGFFTGNPLPNIIIRQNGELHMMDGSGSHHFRSDYDAGNHLPVGTVTVYGKATFRDASSRGINLSGVDIENGGKVVTSTAMGGGEFECGPLTIKAGGELENYTTSDCWGSSAVVTLEEFGTFDTKASSTIFPSSFTNNGTVRYSRDGSTDQQITDMDYYRLEISDDPDNNKIWDLGANR